MIIIIIIIFYKKAQRLKSTKHSSLSKTFHLHCFPFPESLPEASNGANAFHKFHQILEKAKVEKWARLLGPQGFSTPAQGLPKLKGEDPRGDTKDLKCPRGPQYTKQRWEVRERVRGGVSSETQAGWREASVQAGVT